MIKSGKRLSNRPRKSRVRRGAVVPVIIIGTGTKVEMVSVLVGITVVAGIAEMGDLEIGTLAGLRMVWGRFV